MKLSELPGRSHIAGASVWIDEEPVDRRTPVSMEVMFLSCSGAEPSAASPTGRRVPLLTPQTRSGRGARGRAGRARVGRGFEPKLRNAPDRRSDLDSPIVLTNRSAPPVAVTPVLIYP